MAVIERQTTKGRKRWAVKWREGGRQREKWFDRQADARDFDAEIRRTLRSGRVMPDDRVTVRELAVEWWNSHARLKAQRTQDNYRRQLNCRIVPDLGGYRAKDLDRRAVAAYVAKLQAAGVGAATINATLRTLSGIFTKAVEWELVHRNPVLGVPKLPETRRRIEAYRLDQVYALAEAAGTKHHRDYALILTAAFTGLRISEVLALQWQDVREQLIRVDRSLDEDQTFKAPKSYEQRAVPLFDVVRAVLAEWRQHSPRDVDLVFSDSNGGPIRESNWNRRSWQPARNAAGLPHARFHELRHTFASMVIEEGVSVVRLSRWLGHSKPSITLDVYGHLYDEHDTSVFDQVNAKLNSIG